MSALNKIKEVYGEVTDESIGSYLISHKTSASLGILYPYISYRVGISTLPISEFQEIIQYYENKITNKQR